MIDAATHETGGKLEAEVDSITEGSRRVNTPQCEAAALIDRAEPRRQRPFSIKVGCGERAQRSDLLPASWKNNQHSGIREGRMDVSASENTLTQCSTALFRFVNLPLKKQCPPLES